MADVGEELELGEVLLILGAVIFIGYVVYKAFGGIADAFKKIGLCVGSLNPSFGKCGAQLGLRCVPQAIINSGQVSDAMREQIKQDAYKTFPGTPRACIDKNVDESVDAINREAAKGPNFLQYAVNYWFGSHFGECTGTPRTATGDTTGDACDPCLTSQCNPCFFNQGGA